MLRADGRDRARAHVGEMAAVDDRFRSAVGRVHQQEQPKLRRQPLLVVVDIVADDLDAGQVDRRAEGAAQDVEMPGHGLVGHQVHARLDDGLAASLRRETLLDRREDFIVRQRQGGDVEGVEIGQIERGHGEPVWAQNDQAAATVGARYWRP